MGPGGAIIEVGSDEWILKLGLRGRLHKKNETGLEGSKILRTRYAADAENIKHKLSRAIEAARFVHGKSRRRLHQTNKYANEMGK